MRGEEHAQIVVSRKARGAPSPGGGWGCLPATAWPRVSSHVVASVPPPCEASASVKALRCERLLLVRDLQNATRNRGKAAEPGARARARARGECAGRLGGCSPVWLESPDAPARTSFVRVLAKRGLRAPSAEPDTSTCSRHGVLRAPLAPQLGWASDSRCRGSPVALLAAVQWCCRRSLVFLRRSHSAWRVSSFASERLREEPRKKLCECPHRSVKRH